MGKPCRRTVSASPKAAASVCVAKVAVVAQGTLAKGACAAHLHGKHVRPICMANSAAHLHGKHVRPMLHGKQCIRGPCCMANMCGPSAWQTVHSRPMLHGKHVRPICMANSAFAA